jgi:hypothetical protein
MPFVAPVIKNVHSANLPPYVLNYLNSTLLVIVQQRAAIAAQANVTQVDEMAGFR